MSVAVEPVVTDQAVHWRNRLRPHVAPLAMWTVLWLLFWATILLGFERLPNSDLTGQFDAYARFQAAEMLSGRLPLWSDGSFGGVPFVADMQAAVFYLPRWMTVLLSAPWGMNYYALELEALLHIWLTGTFTYAFAFQIVRQRWAAVLAAVSFGLGGYLTSYPLLQLAVLETICWLPLVLLFLRQGVMSIPERRPPWLIAAGLTLALAFTAGHPQTFLHLSYLSAAYFLFLAVAHGWRWRDLLGYGLLIAILAIGVSAAMWLPAITYLPYTVRAEAGYDFVSEGQLLLNYIQLVMPAVYTLWTPEYFGLAPLTLAVVAVSGRKKLFDKSLAHKEILFWLAVVVLAGWLALGDRGILWEAWYLIAPGFQLFRQQERLLGLVVFGGAILAAFGGSGLAGFAAQAEKQRALKRGLIFVAAFLLVAPLILLPTSRILHNPLWLDTWQTQWIMLAIVGGLLWLCISEKRASFLTPDRGLMVLAVLLASDLNVATLNSIQRVAEPPSAIWPEPEWITQLRQEERLGRIDPGFLYFANMGEAYDLETVRGISPLKPQALEEMERLPLGRLWPLLHVTHGLFEEALPDDVAGRRLAGNVSSIIPGEDRPATLYRFEEAQPRAWLSDRPLVATDQEAALNLLLDTNTDLLQNVVLLEETAALYAVSPGTDPLPRPAVEKPAPGEVEISVNTSRDSFLVISEWHLPGWQATVDGQAAELITVNYGLQGLFLPAGEHEISVAFRPPAVWLGITISLITLLLAAGLLFIWWRRTSRGAHTERGER